MRDHTRKATMPHPSSSMSSCCPSDPRPEGSSVHRSRVRPLYRSLSPSLATQTSHGQTSDKCLFKHTDVVRIIEIVNLHSKSIHLSSAPLYYFTLHQLHLLRSAREHISTYIIPGAYMYAPTIIRSVRKLNI